MSRALRPAAVWLLSRPRLGEGAVTGVQLAVAALATLIGFAVAVIACALWRAPEEGPGYRLLALALAGLAALPLVTLGASAARLSARRREERLAALRLLGASVSRVRALAVTETTVVAAGGIAVGTALGLLLPVALEGISVRGERLSAAQLALPWWLQLLIPAVFVGVAALSGALGLRAVAVSPLGVSTRATAPRLSWARVLLALAVIAAATLIARAVSPDWGAPAAAAALGLALIAAMGVLSLLGPFVLLRLCERLAARTSNPARLIGLRGVGDAPQQSWRGVSALALATFIVVPAGSLLGYLDTIQRSTSGTLLTSAQRFLLHDARTLIIALTATAFLVSACQLAMTQLAQVSERRELFVALHRIGVPIAVMQRARRFGALLPAVAAVCLALAGSILLAFPIVTVALATAPLFTLAILGLLALGLALVGALVGATAPALRRQLARASGGAR